MHDFGANVERMRFKEPDRFDKADLWSGVDAKVRKDRKDRRKEGRKPVLWRMDSCGLRIRGT